MTPQARREGLLVQEVGDELAVYDLEQNRVHSLNSTTAQVWRRCDGRTSVTELAAMLAREQGLAYNEDIIWLALEQLERAHLLRKDVAMPTEATKVNRRQLIRKLGLVGGLSLLLPTITSILAPTPATAQYVPGDLCSGIGGTCVTVFEECDGRIIGPADCPSNQSCCVPQR